MEVPGACAELLDLKDLESKVGQKPPDGLLRWLREDPAAHLLRSSPSRGPRYGLGEKIRALKLELSTSSDTSEDSDVAFGSSDFSQPILLQGHNPLESMCDTLS
uniref:Uncharacterized protein n=1 Tax=Sphaerodactylus townsendi TaxID=933632 RepID=A0ACB8F4D7_9SAUR